MKKILTLQTVAGDTLELTVEGEHNMNLAMTAQEPNHSLRLDDGSTLHVNTRNLVAWAEDDAEDDGENDEAEQPQQKMIPDADPEHDPDRTVAQLKDALDAGKIEYPSGAVKAELQALAREHNV